MADLQQIVENLSQLTVLEAAELSRLLEKQWGVSAAAPVTQTISPPEAPIVVPEQDEFAVILNSFAPDKKILVIKEIRGITGLGLKEAKEFTEKAGPTQVVKDSLTKNDANALKIKLEEVGGVVIIQ
jgi:large subunit ribosomal protein L7/L12